MNHVPIYRKLRCFIWKQSKTKAIQRLLYFSCSTEKYWAEFFYGVMNYNPFPSFHIVIETQWSIFLFPFHRDVPMGYSSSFFFFFFKIKCNHTVFDSEEVLVIISVKNYLTILCVFFFVFFSFRDMQLCKLPMNQFCRLMPSTSLWKFRTVWEVILVRGMLEEKRGHPLPDTDFPFPLEW